MVFFRPKCDHISSTFYPHCLRLVFGCQYEDIRCTQSQAWKQPVTMVSLSLSVVVPSTFSRHEARKSPVRLEPGGVLHFRAQRRQAGNRTSCAQRARPLPQRGRCSSDVVQKDGGGATYPEKRGSKVGWNSQGCGWGHRKGRATQDNSSRLRCCPSHADPG